MESAENLHERCLVYCVVPGIGSGGAYGEGKPHWKLARKLLAEFDLDPNTPVEVWRGDTLCFHSTPLSSWAGITVDEGENSACFRPWKPFSEAPHKARRGEVRLVFTRSSPVDRIARCLDPVSTPAS